jgi:biopolymer transport protein ExbD
MSPDRSPSVRLTTASLEAEVNVTPMLDVLLVLLVIFMTAVMGLRRTMDVQLPMPCRPICESDARSIVLEVLPAHHFRINGADVPAALLSRQLESIYAHRPEKILHVAGHPGATYQDVVSAMDVARAAGVLVIGAMLETEGPVPPPLRGTPFPSTP